MAIGIMSQWIAAVVAAYLLGSISFSYLLVRLSQGIDVRTVGSGNPGATNVLRISGKKVALVTLLLDIAKGAAAVALARALGAPGPVIGACALAVVLGHVFPVFFGFRGGKGVATSFGVLAGLAPIPTIAAVVVFVLAVIGTGYVSLASMLGAISLPLFVHLCARWEWTAEAPPWLLWSTALLACLIVARHHANLRRLLQGREPRLYDQV